MMDSSRLGFDHSSPELKLNDGGERAQVRRSHIVPAIGRKDRHSKVCTSKGPRDRRVRLSADTAIQFYDVQDRLGYDRPSKAVDWLMEKAKTAIDALAELPAQSPSSPSVVASAQQLEQKEELNPNHLEQKEELNPNHLQHHLLCNEELETPMSLNPLYLNESPTYATTLFSIPASTAPWSVHFQNNPSDLNLRAVSQSQGLYPSLQGFQDPVIGQHHSSAPISSSDQAIYSASTLLFDAASSNWLDNHPPEMSQPQRIAWNSHTGDGIEGLVFDPLPLALQLPVPIQNQLFSEREPLQSTDSPSTCAWMNPPVSAINDQHITTEFNQSSVMELATDENLRFDIPIRIQGEDEEESAVCNRQSTATTDSHY